LRKNRLYLLKKGNIIVKLLHTSDWHLGQNFMTQSRLEEHQAFLQWLLTTIEEKSIDVLLVAGDIFDTATPPNYALELYYNFLIKSSEICKYIIITAGNHDSIATLKAPKELLEAINVHVIVSGDIDENEIIPLYEHNELCAIVCAVPFLRDYVVRKSLSAELLSEKEYALTKGIQEHYKKVYKEALALQEYDKEVPIIAMGHLTTVGASVSDSEREIYIGGTLNVESDFLAKLFDYVALGHLHVNQKVGSECVRYSGSPIALSFNEASSKKYVNLVNFEAKVCKVEKLLIPCARVLKVIRGCVQEIIEELEIIEDRRTWIEVHLHDENPFHANEMIRQKAKELHLILLAVKVEKKQHTLVQDTKKIISLDEVTPLDIFKKRLDKEELGNEALYKALVEKFNEVVYEVESL